MPAGITQWIPSDGYPPSDIYIFAININGIVITQFGDAIPKVLQYDGEFPSKL